MKDMRRVFFNDEPKSLPKFPESVSTLSGQELADFHALYMAWYAYIADKLKLFKLEETKLKFELGVIIRKGVIQETGKTQKEKEMRVMCTPIYLDKETVWQDKHLICLGLESELSILEKMFMALRSEMRRREV